MRQITITNDPETRPRGMTWRNIWRKKCPGVLGPNYTVRIDAAGMRHETKGADTLTQARRIARAAVRDGAAWAEVFRYAENGVSIKSVFVASYEVETESGSSVK
jgi:hypothetical protein